MKKFRYILVVLVSSMLMTQSCLDDLNVDVVDPDEIIGQKAYQSLADYTSGIAKVYAGLALSGQKVLRVKVTSGELTKVMGNICVLTGNCNNYPPMKPKSLGTTVLCKRSISKIGPVQVNLSMPDTAVSCMKWNWPTNS